MTLQNKRNLFVVDTDVPKHIEFLEDFLGPAEIEHRLKSVDLALRTTSGIYRQYWVLPNSAFWIGLRQARRLISLGMDFAGRLTKEMRKTVEIAAKLDATREFMPQSVQNQFRGRILGSEQLTPVFYEINIAAHFWQLGYEIEWCESDTQTGKRLAEFVAVSSAAEIEVECKTKRPDTRRKISRPDFYRLVDRIASPLYNRGFVGKITISVPNKMPQNDQWSQDVEAAIIQASESSAQQFQLDDNTEVIAAIYHVNSLVVPAQLAITEAMSFKKPHSHLAIFAKGNESAQVNPLIFELASNSHDDFLHGIFDEIRDANRQFSGNRAAFITCFIPEVDTFDGLQSDSALHNMTKRFFRKHAKPYVLAVAYSSEASEQRNGFTITTNSPVLKFENPNYDTKYGAQLSIFEDVQSG
jgi:Holliday junction resolvase